MSYDAIAEELLRATKASRTTIRLDDPDDPCFPVVGEAVAPGVRAIRDERIEEIREAPTFKFIDATHQLLVQGDLETDELQGCPYLRNDFGVDAQMLAPILQDGCMTGIISVHYTGGRRTWSEDDVAALERACDAVYGELGRLAPAR